MDDSASNARLTAGNANGDKRNAKMRMFFFMVVWESVSSAGIVVNASRLREAFYAARETQNMIGFGTSVWSLDE